MRPAKTFFGATDGETGIGIRKDPGIPFLQGGEDVNEFRLAYFALHSGHSST